MALSRMLKWQTSHTQFSVAFPALLYGICNALNFDKLTTWFHDKDGLDYSAFIAYLLAGLCLFIAFFVLFAHRRTIKPMAILLTAASAAATYFIAKYNVAIDSSMIMNTVHTDSVEVQQLLSLQMIPYAVFLIFIPAMVIVATEITFPASGRYLVNSMRLFGTVFAVAIVALYLNYNGIHRAGNISNKYIVYSLVPINFLSGGISSISKSIKPYLQTDPKDIDVDAVVTSPKDLVVVLAIGEASRQKSFSIYGYQRRNTTPELQKTTGLHLLNGIAARGSTLNALLEILEKNGIKLPALVAKAGIPTSCYVNYTMYDNCAAVGETRVSNCAHGGTCFDEDVIPLLDNDLRSYQSGSRFIVLHLGGGSHGPKYSDRHPPEFQKFKPMCNDADVANQCSLEQIFNSYDNTILYVDYVLDKVIKTLDRSGAPYVFIYLSDHGESLMEGGYLFHGMPPGMALPEEQAKIPLIVKSSVPMEIIKRAAYPQPDVYDTVVDLFAIQSSQFDLAGSFIKTPGRPIPNVALAR